MTVPLSERRWTKWKLSFAKFEVLRSISLHLSSWLGAAALSRLPASLQQLTIDIVWGEDDFEQKCAGHQAACPCMREQAVCLKMFVRPQCLPPAC